MSTNPINLTIRFLLELTVLVVMAYWGWTKHEGIARFFWAIGLPILAAVIWGTFAVPDDPSRSGGAPIPIPGSLRLVLELAFFAVGVGLLVAAGHTPLGIVLLFIVLVHYAISYDRIIWLLAQ